MRWRLPIWMAVVLFTCGSAREDRPTATSGDPIEAEMNIQPNLTRNEDENVESSDYEDQGNDTPDTSCGVDTDPETETDVEGSPEIGTPASNVVETTHGPVQGYFYNNMDNITSFIDIQYGKFDGRFQPPTEPDRWESVHQVYEHTSVCPQPVDNETIAGDLNCLTLSIFTPNASENAAVLFHIHDGNFKVGSGDPALYGPEHIVSKGVILVLPNYRLGPLGFLCMRNDSAPGNAGLKDLALALNWIVNNIAAFGGDPRNIVVSGEGLAGILVGYLTLSPMSSMYINKAIIESGSVLSQWAIDRDPVKTSLQLAGKLANTVESGLLTKASLDDLILKSKDILFLPCVEETAEAFMNDTPWNVIHEIPLLNKTFMIGSANMAGLNDVVSHTPESIEDISSDVRLLLPNDLCFRDVAERLREAENIKRQYFGDCNITTETIANLSLYYTDVLYLGPAIRTARPLINSGASVYFYEFSYVGSLNREVFELPIQLVGGAARGDLVGYLFTKDGEMPEVGSEDERMVELMTDVWVSFINTGQPTAEGITWNELKQSEPADEEWLSIGFNSTLERGLHVARLALWTRLYRDHYIEINSAVHLAPCLAFALAILFLRL